MYSDGGDGSQTGAGLEFNELWTPRGGKRCLTFRGGGATGPPCCVRFWPEGCSAHYKLTMLLPILVPNPSIQRRNQQTFRYGRPLSASLGFAGIAAGAWACWKLFASYLALRVCV